MVLVYSMRNTLKKLYREHETLPAFHGVSTGQLALVRWKNTL